MSRLTNKGYTARAPQTAGSVPELPDFDPQLAEAPGGQATNAALQRWWDLVRQRIEFNSGDVTQRMTKISASFDNGLAILSGEITTEASVRANADSVLASDISTVSATVSGLSSTVTTLSSALATATNYLEARWTVNVVAGPIVTGMTLFSALGPDTEVSYIAFQADRFQINTASGGNKVIFAATATAILLGNVLTVDLANSKVFIGTGTYGNANTPFYVDASNNFSLGSKLTWNNTTLTIDGTITATAGTIGGWTINATTIAKNNAILDSAGQLILGTSNDVLYLSATDATYRIWAGNAAAASATFSVTKAGALFSTSGTIGGFTIGVTTLSAGSGATTVSLSTSYLQGLIVGNPAGMHAQVVEAGGLSAFLTYNGNGNIVGLFTSAGGAGDGSISVRNDAATFAASMTPTVISTNGTVQTVSTTDASNSTTAPFKSAGGLAIAKGGYIGTFLDVGTTLTVHGVFNGTTANLSGYGIQYTNWTTNFIGFYWNGTNTLCYVDNTLQGTIPNNGKFLFADGTDGAPSISFVSDTDTGINWRSSGSMGFVTNGTVRMVVRDALVALTVPLKLDNAYVATPPSCTGYVTLQDSGGGTYKVLVST